MRPIRIMDGNFTLLCEIDTYTSFSFSRLYYGVGGFELTMNLNTLYADVPQEGYYVLLDYLSGVITYRERLAGERADQDTLTIKGMALGGLIARRITLPPPGEAYDVFRTDAESAMHGLVNNNAITTSPERVLPRLTLSENRRRGGKIVWQSRLKPLAEELEQIALSTGLGWEITADLGMEMMVFAVLEGRDLTSGQEKNNPVIFSRDYDNLRSQRAVSSNSGFRSTAYVGGQGEGVDRDIQLIGNEFAGLDRFEIFIDARDVSEDDDLLERGRQKLAEYPRILTLQAETISTGPFIYRKDWDLGDIVTVQHRDWGLVMDARITEVQEVIEPNGTSLSVNFGTDLPTFMNRIKKDINQTAQEVTR